MLAPALRQSSELFAKLRGLISHLPYEAELVEAESALRLELSNGSRVLSLPGTEGTVRGYSAPDLIVIDEASRIEDGLYYGLRPMQATNPDGRLILLSTPWGKRGAFWDIWSAGGPEWERVKVTARDCPRISAEWLERERSEMGPLFFASEYECEFLDAVDAAFREADIQAALVDNLQPVKWWSYE